MIVQRFRLRVFIVCASLVVCFFSPSVFQRIQAQSPHKESPMLAEQVAAGHLPPLEERLPETPLVVEPFEAIGKYGGDLRYVGSVDEVSTMISWEFLTKWKPDMSGVYPNIAASYEANEDASEYIFHLRPGMKWSDGHPFTADDIMFAVEDIWFNKELNPTIRTSLTFNGIPVQVEKIDDYTVKFIFSGSYGLFPEMQAWWPAWEYISYPKHWLSQYHIKYNPDGIADMIANAADNPDLAGVSINSWIDLFNVYNQNIMVHPRQVGRPTLYPWITISVDDTTVIMERNPYYWKVDTDGQQLPYIDRIVVDTSYTQSGEAKLLNLLSGEYDTAKDPSLEDYTLFVESQSTSHLQVYDVPSDGASVVSLAFNMTLPTGDLGLIFSDKNFRIGISHALDRQQIVDLVYFGRGTPRQIAPLDDSSLYNEQLANQYTEHSIDLANEYLDKVLPQKDAEGYRLKPNGERMVVPFEVLDQFGLNIPQVAGLVISQMDAVGVAATLTVIDNTTFISRLEGNQIAATLYTAEGGSGINSILAPRWFVPIDSQSAYAPGWAIWYRNPNDARAVEPPSDVQSQIALYQQVLAAANPEDRIKIMSEVLQISADQFYALGIATPPARYWILNDEIRNMPELWYDGWIPGMQSAVSPFQWYFDR